MLCTTELGAIVQGGRTAQLWLFYVRENVQTSTDFAEILVRINKSKLGSKSPSTTLVNLKG